MLRNCEVTKCAKKPKRAYVTKRGIERGIRRCGKGGDAQAGARRQAPRKNCRLLSTIKQPRDQQHILSVIMAGTRRSGREKKNVDYNPPAPKLPGDSEDESGEEPRSSGSSEDAEVEDAQASTDGEDDHEDMQDEEEDLEEGEVLSIESIDGGDGGEGEDAGASSDIENGDEDMQDEENDSEDGAENLEDDDQDTDEKIDERPTKRNKLFMTNKDKLKQAREKSKMTKKEHFAKGFENLPELDRVLTALLLPEVESDPSTKRLLALKKLLDGINENDIAAAPHASRPDNEDDLLRLPKLREVIGMVYEKSSDANRHILFRALDLGTDVAGLTPATRNLKNFAKIRIGNWGHTPATLEAALPELIRLLERMPDEYWDRSQDKMTPPMLLQIAINRTAPTTPLIIRHALSYVKPKGRQPRYL